MQAETNRENSRNNRKKEEKPFLHSEMILDAAASTWNLEVPNEKKSEAKCWFL